jgi:hypothetical protein
MGAAASCSCRCRWSSSRHREKKPEWPCKPSFVTTPFGVGSEHSSRALVAQGPHQRATRAHRAGNPCPLARTRSYWLLLQVGFSVPPESPRARCALTAPFHPYRPLAEPAVCFLWHCPASRLDWSLTSTLPYGARTFLPSPVPAVTSVHPDHSGPCLIQQTRGRGHSGRGCFQGARPGGPWAPGFQARAGTTSPRASRAPRRRR